MGARVRSPRFLSDGEMAELSSSSAGPGVVLDRAKGRDGGKCW